MNTWQAGRYWHSLPERSSLRRRDNEDWAPDVDNPADGSRTSGAGVSALVWRWGQSWVSAVRQLGSNWDSRRRRLSRTAGHQS